MKTESVTKSELGIAGSLALQEHLISRPKMILDALESAIMEFTKVRIKPAPASAWVKFLTLPQETQEMILTGWRGQTDFIRGAIDQDLDACDEIRMLEYAMGRLNLLCDTSLIADLSHEDVIEIYGPDYVQVYRSFNYFSLCNYSLLELGVHPWYELYDRSTAVMKQLIEMTESVLCGKTSRIDLDKFPEYTIREVMSPEGAVFSMREKCAVRLASSINGQNYLMSVKKVKEISATLPDESKIRFI